MANYFKPLASATIGAASNSVNHQRQMDILDYTKTLAESALQLSYAAKEGGGNPKVRLSFVFYVGMPHELLANENTKGCL